MPIYATGKVKNGIKQYIARINFTDETGKYRMKQKTVWGRSEALDEERKMLMESADVPTFRKFREIFEEYEKEREYDIRATTIDKDRRMFLLHIDPYLGNVRADKLTVPVMRKWKETVSQLDIATVTMRKIYTFCNMILKYAVRVGYIKENPLDRIGNFKNTEYVSKEDKLHYYTAEQFKEYIAQARKMAQEADNIIRWGIYTFFNLAFFTGARKGEINALKWSDVDGQYLNIRRSVAQKLKTGDVETAPKTKSSYRKIKMPSSLIAILQEQKERQKKIPGFTEDFRLCGASSVLRDTTIENYNILFSKSAGLPHIRVHDFRHSHAALLANAGVNIQEIAHRLGHSDVSVTWNTYSHMYPEQEDLAVSALEKI